MEKLFVEMKRYWMENVILSGDWRQKMENGDTGAMWMLTKTVQIFRMAGLLKPAS